MDPIGNVNPLLDALRRQLAENIERLRRSGRLAAASTAGRGERAARAEGLEPLVRRKVAALERRSPEGRRQATRAFVEAVLVSEFGEALLADPALGGMIEEIGDSLREDPQVREQLDAMLSEL